jgi:hypothetical protein
VEFIKGNQEKKAIFYRISSDIEKMNWPVSIYLESQDLNVDFDFFRVFCEIIAVSSKL